jgi:hypothetical protein
MQDPDSMHNQVGNHQASWPKQQQNETINNFWLENCPPSRDSNRKAPRPQASALPIWPHWLNYLSEQDWLKPVARTVQRGDILMKSFEWVVRFVKEQRIGVP